MTSAIQFPDRGKAARELLGSRLTVAAGKGQKSHRAVWYHVTLRGVEGAYLETDCGRFLDFRPFDGPSVETDTSEWREVKGGEHCQRCAASMGMMMLGQSRKRAFKEPSPRRERKRPETFDERRGERLRDRFFQAAFGVSAKEADRRGIVSTGRGRKASYRLGEPDGSEGPAA
jgi:hypothetical protein